MDIFIFMFLCYYRGIISMYNHSIAGVLRSIQFVTACCGKFIFLFKGFGSK